MSHIQQSKPCIYFYFSYSKFPKSTVLSDQLVTFHYVFGPDYKCRFGPYFVLCSIVIFPRIKDIYMIYGKGREIRVVVGDTDTCLFMSTWWSSLSFGFFRALSLDLFRSGGRFPINFYHLSIAILFGKLRWCLSFDVSFEKL